MTARTIHPPFTPYQPGDPISVEYLDDEQGTVLAELKVERCVKLAGHESDPRWRVTVRRLDGRLHDANVDEHGRDRHGYVRKPERAR